ncbi:predicted protein [Nematostella vectensis]|uniref:Tetratricopeptide repeat protein 36 homolog n=1 Tax=Nematostella vectensis TaxID=45351 RepID=TTC36_NEMVE|nr:tetratricopeptide repeat protein 36 homolog [Nematostella vectensis]A7RL75.1 RecName: Full=Tetratricopeptide repeat protein 36 homolog; Short=TPR repeat protein 36 homolog [Nematostella vectensis]EDO47811.1 predicted protein [Nematostella vectensis]|eukprot:XP_001639874.1 predicted protein [Nematostella vectensis]
MAASVKDRAVLDAIFNPLLPLGDCPQEIIEEELPIENTNEDDVKRAKEYEIQGVEKAEAGDFVGALDCFNKAIDVAPLRASGYNNRAQLSRLRGDNQSAMEDLNKAIELSHEHGAAAAQAYTQRGLLHRLEGNDEAASEDFQHGATLGNAFAKAMTVQLNPYAAMCNKMLAEAIGKLSGHA